LRVTVGTILGLLASRHTEQEILEAYPYLEPGDLQAASIGLVRRHGFLKEGFSPKYLKIGGRWRDHERWALLRDNWRPRD
jgi:ribosomal-protein-alanine N-acetyltransferase